MINFVTNSTREVLEFWQKPRKPRLMSDKVVISEHLDEEAAEWLQRHVPIIGQSYDEPQGFGRELKEATGLIVRTYTQVDDHLLDMAPKLKVVGRAGVGLDNIDLEACRRRGVRVVYTPDANTQAVVEYVMALILDAVRPRVYMEGYVNPAEFHQYRENLVGRQLSEMILGVLGMGRIGKRIARVASTLGMRVIYSDLLSREQLGLSPDDPYEEMDVQSMFALSDILTVHVDGRPTNRHFINEELVMQLNPGCTLINTSRGMVIENNALRNWAQYVVNAGGRAILDVHDPEPPTEDYPLFNLPNVRLLPHLASRTFEAMSNMSQVVKDVWRVLNGQDPVHAAV